MTEVTVRCKKRGFGPVFALLGLIQSVCLGSTAVAGWNSGGGDLAGALGNPWFLENTKVVPYCVDLEPRNFSVSKSRVIDLIERSIEFWKDEFNSQVKGSYQRFLLSENTARLGTQSFVREEACGSQTLIRFVFGRSPAASPETRRFAATTQLEFYNRISLRGQGAIYVLPDVGLDRFRSESGIESAWTQGENGLLLHTLIHELGHVFGIQHEGPPNSIMSREFVEHILDKKNFRKYAFGIAVPGYVVPVLPANKRIVWTPKIWERDQGQKASLVRTLSGIREIFRLKEGETALAFLRDSQNSRLMTVQAGNIENVEMDEEKIEWRNVAQSEEIFAFRKERQPRSLFLPEGQRVFDVLRQQLGIGLPAKGTLIERRRLIWDEAFSSQSFVLEWESQEGLPTVSAENSKLTRLDLFRGL